MIKRVLSKLRKVTMSLFAVLCAGAVWAEEGEVTTPEVTPEPDPAPSTSALSIDSSAGYVLTGLGELGDQAALVFTNSNAAINWTVPKNLKNVEILVVGGGGGGGGHYYNATAKNCQGGAGGGAGAVVTGFIKDLAADQVVNVTVGAGGAGGAATTSTTAGSGKGGNGGNSVLKVGDVTYVTAYGGGGDGGYNSAGVANGGSNSGVRGTKTAANLKSVTVVGEGAESLVTDIVARANIGGGGYTTSSGYPGAGGGGADSAGHPTYGGSSCGGTGGFGYVSYITGERVVYGAGGGGGIGKNGGDATYLEDDWIPLLEGAGLGKAGQPGSDALANQGAGGGGGSWKQKGGNGGSGIVVLRFAYSDVDIPVDVAANILPKISDKVYTGSALVSGLENTYAYTVEELGERINVGQQTVRVTLNDGYVWADGDTNKTKEFTWNITQEVNNWKVEPYLSHTAWPDNFASSVNFKFTAPETSFGVLQAELSANGAAPQPFSGTLPTESGSYTLRYWVEGTANWAAKEWTVNFKIYQSEAFAEGYKVYGLGENGDEVAVVFTQNATWTVPANLKSAQFLVVGGGGGGGADCHDDAASGGAGGGGGGVVTGEVDLTKDATVAVTIGAGGAGGTMRTSQADGESGTFYGASKKGGNSVLSVGGTTYVTAYGGGRDRGTTKRDSSSITTANMSEGGQGGSNGGSRGGFTADQSKNPTMGAVASNAALRNCTTYGNKGGKGCSEYFYGYPSAGGGGGATEAGGDAGNNATGWPGGKGGEGLASDITGARLVYGSGGGGSSTQGSLGGVGGSGAGNGGDREDAQGTSALANQGGGGGGTSRELTYGGNGGSGVVVIRYSVYAAEVAGVEYATFAEAFDAAQAGETVKLLNDVTLAEKLTIKKAVTLDLNGCTLSETVTDNYGALYVGTAGNLTITDSAEGGKIATDGGVVVGNYGTVTVNGGTIEAGAVAEDDVAVYNFYYNGSTYGKLTVNGGKVGRIWNCGNANITAGEVVDIDNSGAMTIAGAATVSGTVIIKNGSDAAEVPGAGTLTAPEGFTAESGVDGYKVVYADGKYTLVLVWTAPLPEKDGAAPITEEYTLEVLEALEAAVATSVDVKVNGVELNGNEAVKALNTAVASFDNALTFDGTAANLDIEIEVTEVNTEDPAASTVVVKRGTEELTVKVTPKVKYFYPETKTWGSDKPESGAVLFKLVF